MTNHTQKRSWVKKLMWAAVGLGIVGLVGAFTLLPKLVDRASNQVVMHAPYKVSPSAQTLHDRLRIGDLHSDTLLWGRNPAKRHSFGHTDLPRFRTGNVALQVFAAVTYVPSTMNEISTPKGSDKLTALTIVQLWPARTWGSVLQRALYQAQRLSKLAARDPDFRFVRTSAELARALADRQTNNNVLIGLMASEGAHPLEGKLSNIDTLYDHGYRIMGLQHFFDNELGGSMHGVSKAGLTQFGRNAVTTMLAKGMILDLAHSSQASVRDVLAISDAPMIISHTGILSACDHPARNLPDDLLQTIADNGGLIGVGFWEMAVCDPSPSGVAAMIKHGINTFGADHIALGSDYDGATSVQFDVSELPVLTQALLDLGVDPADIAKVMGENQIEFFLKSLPNP